MFIAPLFVITKNWKQTSWRMDKQTAVHPHNGILLSYGKEQAVDTRNCKDESQMHYAKCTVH